MQSTSHGPSLLVSSKNASPPGEFILLRHVYRNDLMHWANLQLHTLSTIWKEPKANEASFKTKANAYYQHAESQSWTEFIWPWLWSNTRYTHTFCQCCTCCTLEHIVQHGQTATHWYLSLCHALCNAGLQLRCRLTALKLPLCRGRSCGQSQRP